MSITNNILNLKPKEVKSADHRCEFEFLNTDETCYMIESKYAFGYCVIDAKGQEQHYVTIEQDNNLLEIYPPCNLIGLTDFISFEGLFIECWSLSQFCQASSSYCASISRLDPK